MRICHVLETGGGGSAQIVLDLAHYALDQGDDVTVLYSPDRAESRFVAALSSLEGIQIAQAPMRRSVGLRDLRDGWRLHQTLKRLGPFDIVHAHSSKAGALARIAGLFLPGVTVVYTPHCFYSMTPGAPRRYALIERVLSWVPTKIIAVSQHEYQHALEIGIGKDKLVIIPNGIAGSNSSPRDQARKLAGVENDTIVIGFIGRLEEQKNPIRAIEVFHQIARRFPFARLIMIGDGKLRPAVEETVAALDLRNRISLLGSYDARAIIPSFDCLLCSSDFEAFPVVFLEALAAGVPIVTTPVGGAEEAVVDGITGFVAEAAAASALTLATEKFLLCPADQRQNMFKNAKEHSDLFTTETMGARYSELYRQCHSYARQRQGLFPMGFVRRIAEGKRIPIERR
jgi:glycosyltransferase involved in cell wall biosynthesis